MRHVYNMLLSRHHLISLQQKGEKLTFSYKLGSELRHHGFHFSCISGSFLSYLLFPFFCICAGFLFGYLVRYHRHHNMNLLWNLIPTLGRSQSKLTIPALRQGERQQENVECEQALSIQVEEVAHVAMYTKYSDLNTVLKKCLLSAELVLRAIFC